MALNNYKFKITSLKSTFPVIVIFCAFIFLKGSLIGQDFSTDKRPSVQTENLYFLEQTILKGSTEQKRDALLQIRNLKSAAASRVAVPALRDDSEIVRATAAGSVIFLPLDEAAVLLPLIADVQPLVRREAAYALGKIGNPSVINQLLQIIQKDKIAEVRNAAIVALGEIGDASVVPELVKILQRKPQTRDEFMRRAAARSIGQIAQIIQIGKVSVLTPENFLPEKFKSTATPKHPILVETFPVYRPAIETLIQVLRDQNDAPDVKREAAFALGAIADESAVSVLETHVNNEDYYLAEISRESLRKIKAAQSR